MFKMAIDKFCFLLVVISVAFFTEEVEALTNDEIDNCLYAHNAMRNLHPGTPYMTWDTKLMNDAQGWADHIGDDLKSLVHATKDELNGQGENLFMKAGTGTVEAVCAEAVLAWYNEILDYDYTTTKTKNPGKAIGHFTQVVWKDSVKVGCGIKIVQDGGTTTVYIVGRYLPGGNFVMLNMGEQYDDGRKRVYGENVLAASGAPTPTLQQLNEDAKKPNPFTNPPTQAPPATTAGSSGGGGSGSGSGSGTFEGNCLYSHNTLRALHPGTPEMTYDATIAEGSQKWADNLGDNIKSLIHATGAELGDNGENIFMKSFSGSMDVTCSEAAWAWYNEIHDYSYSTTKTTKAGKMIGHFTQVVWTDSIKTGCGIKSNTENGMTTVYIVCRYNPKGNFVMANVGESFEDARLRVYKDKVLAASGDPIPTVEQLNEGAGKAGTQPTPKPGGNTQPGNNATKVVATDPTDPPINAGITLNKADSMKMIMCLAVLTVYAVMM